MQTELFTEPKEEYALVNETTRRVIFRRKSTAAQAAESNEHFIKSLCPHLQIKRASEIQARNYTVKR